MAGRDHGMDFAQEVLGTHLAPVPVVVTVGRVHQQ